MDSGVNCALPDPECPVCDDADPGAEELTPFSIVGGEVAVGDCGRGGRPERWCCGTPIFLR